MAGPLKTSNLFFPIPVGRQCIWSGTPVDGHLRIFLDGSNTPAVDLAFQDYFNRTQAPFIYPSLVYDACKGLNSYVPIPYNVSCKVVLYGNRNTYYQFNYSTFAPGVTVPAFMKTDCGRTGRAFQCGRFPHEPPRLRPCGSAQ